jgi:uncharacterized protein (DUF3820 family)
LPEIDRKVDFWQLKLIKMNKNYSIPQDINTDNIYDNVTMPFGKYQGKVILQLEDVSYLKFMLTCKIQRSVRGAIEKRLEMLNNQHFSGNI